MIRAFNRGPKGLVYVADREKAIERKKKLSRPNRTNKHVASELEGNSRERGAAELKC